MTVGEAVALGCTLGLPRREAGLVVAGVLGWPSARVWTEGGRVLPAEAGPAVREALRRRAEGEPLAYITGWRAFWTLELRVTPDVLIPRPETEVLVEAALGLRRDRPEIWADIGTGSGAIAAAALAARPALAVVATDISEPALAVARDNLARLGLLPRARLLAGDLLQPLLREGVRVHALLANLPYVPTGELEALQPEVRREPRLALDGGPDGLAVIRRLCRELAAAPWVLLPGAHVLLEVGAGQAQAVGRLLQEALGEGEVRIWRDLAGRERVVAYRQGGAGA
jgi:release factor glutamine methyltransferase